MAFLTIQQELSMCDMLCNAQNRAYTLQAKAQVVGDDATAANFGVDASHLDVQIELLQNKINVQWVAAAGDAITTFTAAQQQIQTNVKKINDIITADKNIATALGALDQIIALASKLVAI